MGKRMIFICLWTVAFILGSAMLLGVASFLYFAVNGNSGEQTISWIAKSWSYLPLVVGPIGLMLAVMGLLPGTTRRST
jgi:TRAP-type C4-dicarboxylate transport system permease small subunit